MAKTGTTAKRRIVAGLDIGSSKVLVIIASVGAETIDVIGLGSVASQGVRQGSIVDIEATTQAIIKAREEAELMAGVQITEAWVGVAGTHITSFDSRGMVAILHEEVAPSDVERVIDAAKAVAIPTDREVLHVLAREFQVDDQKGILDPIGMSGVRLEASVHIITASHTALTNIRKCTEKAGLRFQGAVLKPLASALSVLSDDEKNLGVAVVDMGAGTCDIAVYHQGSVVSTSFVPVGGQHFTHDVSLGLRSPQASAEFLKKKHGCALADLVSEEENIEVEGVGGRNPRTVRRKSLSEVLEPRAEETLEMIQEKIRDSGYLEILGSGIVLTGGASQLEGLIEMGEFIFDVPVRMGSPTRCGGLTDVVRSPVYATGIGLLLYAAGQLREEKQEKQDHPESLLSSWARRVKEYFTVALD